MRPIQHGDLTAAARALLPVPIARRARTIQTLLHQAEAADRFRKKLGRVHPNWGNGTLMAAALAQTVPNEPRLDDPDYLNCQAHVIAALISRRPITNQDRDHKAFAFSRTVTIC